MAQAIIIAVLAGLASVLLAATIAAGYGGGVALALFSPLPLMVAAIGWHPLLAILGGALTAAALSALFQASTGLVFIVLVALPAYLTANLIVNRPLPGGHLVGALALFAAAYATFATLVGALSISLDFEVLQQQLLRQSEAFYRITTGVGTEATLPELVNGRDPQIFIKAYASAMAPLFACIMTLVYMLNIWLAAKACKMSGRFPGLWLSTPSMRLPFIAAPLAVILPMLVVLGGYLGLIFEMLGLALLMVFIAQGYAAVHDATREVTARGAILTGLWALTFFAGFPALIMLLAGLADCLFRWRDRVLAGRSVPPLT